MRENSAPVARRNALTGRECDACHRPTRTGPLGGPDHDTAYSCDGCAVHLCWDCYAAHECETT